MSQRLRVEWERAQRSGEPLALLRIDVDRALYDAKHSGRNRIVHSRAT